MSSTAYVLGHAPDELRRLDEQSAILRPATAALLGGCGLRAGMRVLDVGCGTGEVTMMCAEAVGAVGRGHGRGPGARGPGQGARPRRPARRRARALPRRRTSAADGDGALRRGGRAHGADAPARPGRGARPASRPRATRRRDRLRRDLHGAGPHDRPRAPAETRDGWIDRTLARAGVAADGHGPERRLRRAGPAGAGGAGRAPPDGRRRRGLRPLGRRDPPHAPAPGRAARGRHLAAVNIATLADRLDDEAAAPAAPPCPACSGPPGPGCRADGGRRRWPAPAAARAG